MDQKLKNLMKPFYFGSINEEERLFVERELLTDPELLLGYFDLKRSLEAAEEIPPVPSTTLFRRIFGNLRERRRLWASLAISAALAATLAYFTLFRTTSRPIDLNPTLNHRALFDSSADESLSLDIL